MAEIEEITPNEYYSEDENKKRMEKEKKEFESEFHSRSEITNKVFNRMIILYLQELANSDWLYKMNNCLRLCNCKSKKDKKKKDYFLSYGFIIRVIWRLAAVTSRFVIISLIWVVLGGAIEVGFIAIVVYIWLGGILMYSGTKTILFDMEEDSYYKIPWIKKGCAAMFVVVSYYVAIG